MVVRNQLITKSERACLVNLLSQDGIKSRVKVFCHILNKSPATELNTNFEVSQKLGVTGFENV
jgi:hypothetical protein